MNSIDWVPTGSSVSGSGYGFQIYRDEQRTRFAVRLAFSSGTPFFCELAEGQRHAALVPADTFNDAYALGERFCHAWHQWQTVQRRERALSQGFAVLG